MIPGVTRGNREPRKALELEEYIDNAIKSYLSEESPTIKQAFTLLEAELDRHTECNDTQFTFEYESFRKRIVKKPDYERLLIKKGKKAADIYYKKVGQRPETTRVLQRVEADRVIEGLIAAMQADGDELLSEDEKQLLVKAIESLIELRNGDDADAIEQGIKDTDKASQDFASRRMDKSIRAALAGHSVDEI